MCFIIIHKVIILKEMKMKLFLQKLFFCPVYQLSVPNETAPRSPNPPPPPICVPAQSISRAGSGKISIYHWESPEILLDRLQFRIVGLGNIKSCDLITKISIIIHVSNVHTFKKGSAITQNPNVWDSYHIQKILPRPISKAH